MAGSVINHDSPALTALRTCYEAVQAGQASPDDLDLTLQAYSDRVQFELNRLEGQVFHGHSSWDDPIFSAIFEGFEMQLDAVAQCYDDDWENGLKSAQRANNFLMAAHQRLMERVEAQSRVICPFCNTNNERGSERCGGCKRHLPEAQTGSSMSVVQEEGLAKSDRPMTENALKLTRAIESEMSFEELYQVMDEVEERLMGHQENYAGPFHEETVAALERSLEALDEMRTGEGHVTSGMEKFLTASDDLLALLARLEADHH
ncbi:hypothetical protein ABS71_10795 [bacterium SCN 62-11]|nr:hypothetical protein [Candidatus Eremiobacteraeota bacterium]ODT67461.1 MAG: hypothetical protein ABS71_10795 [bacterium SCN 62-11]